MEEVMTIIILFGMIILCIVAHKQKNTEAKSSIDKERQDSIEKAYLEIENQRTVEKLEAEKKLKQKVKNELKEKNQRLNNFIKEKIKRTESENIKLLLENILSTEVTDELSYAEKEWLFNDGNLRTLSEIEQHKHDLKEKYYNENPEEFDRECRNNNLAFFIIPFITVFIIGMAMCSQDTGGMGDPVSWILIAPFVLLVTLAVTMVFMGIGHRHNLNKAKEYNICNSRTAYEQRELNTLKVGGAASALSMLRNVKKAVKDVTNVDGWKEMK